MIGLSYNMLIKIGVLISILCTSGGYVLRMQNQEMRSLLERKELNEIRSINRQVAFLEKNQILDFFTCVNDSISELNLLDLNSDLAEWWNLANKIFNQEIEKLIHRFSQTKFNEQNLSDLYTCFHRISASLDYHRLIDLERLGVSFNSKPDEFYTELNPSHNRRGYLLLIYLTLKGYNVNWKGTFAYSTSPGTMVLTPMVSDTILLELSNLRFDHSKLEGGFFENVNFDDLSLNYSDFSGADLANSSLKYTTLIDANLKETKFNGADLRWVDLSGADLSGASLYAADLTDANLESAKISYEQLFNTYSLYNTRGIPIKMLKQLKREKPSLFINIPDANEESR